MPPVRHTGFISTISRGHGIPYKIIRRLAYNVTSVFDIALLRQMYPISVFTCVEFCPTARSHLETKHISRFGSNRELHFAIGSSVY